MTKHLHHVTPVHLGGKDGPLVLLEDYEHAQLHFERFMNGEDRWLHGGFLRLLEPEQVKAVRSRYSELQAGENNHMYGVEPTIKGWNWWTDGETDLMSEKQPGPDFFKGRTNVSRGHDGVKGQHWFNNGIEEILDFSCPEGFIEGRLPTKRPGQAKAILGRKWWHNGSEEVLAREQPEGFVRGRLPGQKRNRKP